MRLSRRERWRFRVGQAGEWVAGYGLAFVVVAGLLGLFVFAGRYAFDGEAKRETAVVTGFGAFATDVGELPLVAVRLGDGRTRELQTSPAAIRGCRIGDPIALVRRRSSLMVALEGCRR